MRLWTTITKLAFEHKSSADQNKHQQLLPCGATLEETFTIIQLYADDNLNNRICSMHFLQRLMTRNGGYEEI